MAVLFRQISPLLRGMIGVSILCEEDDTYDGFSGDPDAAVAADPPAVGQGHPGPGSGPGDRAVYLWIFAQCCQPASVCAALYIGAGGVAVRVAGGAGDGESLAIDNELCHVVCLLSKDKNIFSHPLVSPGEPGLSACTCKV